MATKMAPHEVLSKSSGLVVPGDYTDGYLQTKVLNGLTEPIPVEVVSGTSGTSINQTGEALAVASGLETQIAFYTVPVGKIFYIERVEYDGTNLTEYKVKIAGVRIAQRRTYWTGGFSGVFEFSFTQSVGLSAVAGDIISVTALHSSVSSGDYFARIQGSIKDV